MEDKKQTQEDRMKKINEAFRSDGFKDKGEAEHPRKYPSCRKFAKGDKFFFVAPAVEDYRCVTIWNEHKCLVVVNTMTMKLVNTNDKDYRDTNRAIEDFLRNY